MPSTILHFTPIERIRDLYQPGYGRHWFDADTTRYFRTRYPEGGYTTADGQQCFFVTSERGPRNVRAYTVRVLIAPEGYDAKAFPRLAWEVETVEPFNELTRSVANRMARDLATGKLVLRYENYKHVAALAD
jgi:hypothetical protein